MATKLSDVKPAAAKAGKKPAVAPKALGAEAPEVEQAAVPALEITAAAPVLKVKDMVDRVALASGAKKKGLREIVEAVLLEMGNALSEGKELNLPPLGRVRVNRQKGDLMVVKVKRPVTDKSVKKDVTEGVAVAED